MWKWIFKDILISLVALFLTLFIVYVAFVSVNDNPFKSREIDFVASPEGYKALLHANQIDLPAVERFGVWLTNLFNGSFSQIYVLKTQSSENIAISFFAFLKTSMQVQIPAFLFGMILGLGLGFLAGYQYASKKARGKIVDSAISGFVSVFASVPMIVLATFVLIIAPYLSLKTQYEFNAGTTALVMTLILPVLISTLVSLSSWTIVMRIEVANVLTSDYILAAKTRGYTPWFIFSRYVLRNTMYPFVGRLTSAYLVVFSSSYIVEVFFGVPGPSTWLVSAIASSEVNILMFQLLFFGLLTRVMGIFSNAIQFSINPLVKKSFDEDKNYWKRIRAWNLRRNSEDDLNNEEPILIPTQKDEND